tara:strand:+ start:634 stop:1938 length:1305 start_codon:yes stop_codon:yes gene_type:complete
MAIQFYDSIDLNRQQLLNVRIQNVASDPTTNNVVGQIIFNTQDDTLKQYVDDAGSGSPGWVAVGGVTYDLLVTESTGGSNADPYITLDPSIGTDDNVQIEGGTGVTVTKDGTAKITISATGGTGTVTSVATNNGLTGGTITTTGTLGLKLADTDNYIMGRTTAIAAAADTIAFNDDDASTANTVVKTTFATIPMAALTLVKTYIDDAVVGGLIYQGGYNAATNSPDLDSSPSSDIKKGWTYTVTADGSFFTEQVRVGDVLIAEVNAPTALTDWTTVQNNIDLADLTTVGIGNVNASAADLLDGLSVTYSGGTATVGLDVTGLDALTAVATDDELVIFDESQGTDGQNKKITVANLLSGTSGVTTFAANVTSITAGTPKTVTHSLNSLDVMVQLFDDATKETIYATVDRTGVNTVDLTFNATAPTTVRILVQKIG